MMIHNWISFKAMYSKSLHNRYAAMAKIFMRNTATLLLYSQNPNYNG